MSFLSIISGGLKLAGLFKSGIKGRDKFNKIIQEKEDQVTDEFLRKGERSVDISDEMSAQDEWAETMFKAAEKKAEEKKTVK